MIRAFGGAFSLALTILVLRLALPEIGDLLVTIIVKILVIINQGLDVTVSTLPR
ncbi:MAG: hypothetical protein Q7T50_01960 [Candidatus Magasanikbacteria bacterium]|nr:hypothetical protein [Candidatus Magasanikbacteria bacterium]